MLDDHVFAQLMHAAHLAVEDLNDVQLRRRLCRAVARVVRSPPPPRDGRQHVVQARVEGRLACRGLGRTPATPKVPTRRRKRGV
jgi:hypothetical protein